MDIWDYDRRTGELLGKSLADPCPQRAGDWLVPAFATTIRPPVVPLGCVAVFDGDWHLELIRDPTGAGGQQ